MADGVLPTERGALGIPQAPFTSGDCGRARACGGHRRRRPSLPSAQVILMKTFEGWHLLQAKAKEKR